MNTQRSPQPTSIRLPAQMKQHLRIMAAIHEQSLSDEIMVRLHRSISEEERAAGDQLGGNAPAAKTNQKAGQECV